MPIRLILNINEIDTHKKTPYISETKIISIDTHYCLYNTNTLKKNKTPEQGVLFS